MTKLKTTCAVLALLLSQPVLAVNLWCTGSVSRVYVDSASRMYIMASWKSSYSMICDLDTTWNGITPELCKSWFAMLEGAYHAQTTVIVYYSGVSYGSCAEIPNYTASPKPGYVMNR